MKTKNLYNPLIESGLQKISTEEGLKDWTATTSYTVGEYAVYQGHILRCTVAHTSSATIGADIVNWASVDESLIITALAGVVAGQVVKNTLGAYGLAQADIPDNQGVYVCLASDGTNVMLVYGGNITLTTAEWDAVAGTTGGLTSGEAYLLSQTVAGAVQETDVTVPPRQVVYYALSSTEAKVMLQPAEGSVLGVVALNRQFPTTDYTVLTTDKEVIAKAGCTAITLYPTTSYPSSKLDGIKISNQSGLTISVAPNGADTVNGTAGITLVNTASAVLTADGTNWIIY